MGAFERIIWVGAVAAVSIVLTAAYMLRLYQKTMTGEPNPRLLAMKDLGGREVTALVPIAALTIVLGLYPAPVLKVVEPSVQWTMEVVGMSDPDPVVDVEEGQQ